MSLAISTPFINASIAGAPLSFSAGANNCLACNITPNMPCCMAIGSNGTAAGAGNVAGLLACIFKNRSPSFSMLATMAADSFVTGTSLTGAFQSGGASIAFDVRAAILFFRIIQTS